METADDALLCPLTLALFHDPVVAEDGHTYERNAIETWIQKNGTSPITRKPILLTNLIPNYTVKKIIDRFENSLRDKKYQYKLDVDVKKKKDRPMFQTFGKTIYHAEWLPTNEGRPDIVLLKIDGARANKEASFYVNLSRHPHIVRTFGLVRDNDADRNFVILLQECASEGSLYELICERKKPLDEKILLQVFLQIIDAMSYLASNNVVHGDLACRNVLVFRFDEQDPRNIVVKVTDFGLSRYSNIYTQVASVARTTLSVIPVRYSAPEILTPNAAANVCTEKSDVYAMGVLIWEAYSRGAIPWTDIPNDEDVIQRVRRGDTLPQPPNCSSQYWNIITRTWSQLPAQRTTFEELKKLFIDQLYQTTISTSKPSMLQRSYCQAENE